MVSFFIYLQPLLRLFFKFERKGMLVYVIALEEELNFELKVAQPEEKSDLEARIEALEKEVYKTSKSEKKED